ncbi:MAG: AI-2E family transporter [Patescibacteria group bacterium]
MSRFNLDSSQVRALAIVTLLAFVASIIFLRQYLILVAVAAIVAYVFNPVYLKLNKRWSNPGRASSVTLLITLLSILIPVSLVMIILVLQLNHFVNVVKDSGANLDPTQFGQNIFDGINNVLKSIGISYQINQAAVSNALASSIQSIGESLLKSITSSINGVIGFITIAIIYMYVFVSMLKHQTKIMDTMNKLNPLGGEISQLYFSRMGAMTGAMVRGQFIIAFCQGMTDALLLYAGGIHTAFLFFAVILVCLSIIPLGGGILVLPIGALMVLTGNIWGGMLVILGHLLIVTNIDNVLRPRLVPEKAKLDPALTLLSVFAGLGLFGFIGIVLGPVIMIVLVTTLQVYLEVFKGDPLVDAKDKNHVKMIDSLRTKLHLD